METNNVLKHNNTFLWVIGALSVLVPILVAMLFYVPKTGGMGSFDASFLPHMNALLNTATSISLILGYIFIKRNKQRYHITAMITAFALSSIFLISYVIYHYLEPGTKFGDLNHDQFVSVAETAKVGSIRFVYYFILITHIILAAIVVPFVLFAVYYGISKQFQKHKKIVKWTFPIWLYVAITGVLVYLMISPYYSN